MVEKPMPVAHEETKEKLKQKKIIGSHIWQTEVSLNSGATLPRQTNRIIITLYSISWQGFLPEVVLSETSRAGLQMFCLRNSTIKK